MFRPLLLSALAISACGDNLRVDVEGEPLARASELSIVAHQDDDLLFIQPDLYEAVLRRTGLTSVYVTAGNGRHGVETAERRNGALRDAYAAIAGEDVSDWACGWIDVAGRPVEHCRLAAAAVSLVFLGYPDGGREGQAHDSLLRLWEGKIPAARTVSHRPTVYDQPSLIAALTEIIDATAPATLRTLEVASTHGRDHADHMIVGALAVLATAASSQAPDFVSYRGYNSADEPPNTGSALFSRSAEVLRRYEACARGCAPCGPACGPARLDEAHMAWLERRYAIGMRSRGAGLLRQQGRCLDVAAVGAPATMSDCATAPTWRLDDQGALRASTAICLEALPTGALIGAPCRPRGPGGRFFLDDDGHLWSGLVPAPRAGMAYAHLSCVSAISGPPRTALCGDRFAPAWELSRTTATTAREATSLTRAGRAVRMARLAGRTDRPAMLCAIEPEARGLQCAPGAEGGGVLPAVRIDAADAPLAIEPESLTLGDVDGDARIDACGRDPEGILCATAASGYRATRWSRALAGSAPAGAADRSLAIGPDGALCWLGPAGVACVRRASDTPAMHSGWPDRRAALWFADLDGDRQLDWCSATAAGPACHLAADAEITADGAPWGYAQRGAVESSAAEGPLPDAATAVFSDVDGDGRDDLCTIRPGAITCARSTGHGFAPRIVVARLPAEMTPTSLWAEPSCGRAPRLCAADATQIACTE